MHIVLQMTSQVPRTVYIDLAHHAQPEVFTK